MHIESRDIARIVTINTGLKFNGRHGVDSGNQWIELHLDGHAKSSTFTIKAIIGWRHIEVLFKPGAYAGELLTIMRNSDYDSRNLFISLLEDTREKGTAVSLSINDRNFDFNEKSLWDNKWVKIALGFRVGQIDLSAYGENDAHKIVQNLISSMAATVISLMPIEKNTSEETENEQYPEGASVSIEVNRYERDPRNRAAALAIHGYACMACGVLMSNIYGDIVDGFIEVHHTKPISQLGKDYLINPVEDLLPLCPNCHSVIHRRDPPYTLSELKALLVEKSEE